MFEIAFLKAASELDDAISLGSLFRNCSWMGKRNTCSNPRWLLAVCKSTLWSELSTNGARIVVWHLRERLACIAFYTA